MRKRFTFLSLIMLLLLGRTMAQSVVIDFNGGTNNFYQLTFTVIEGTNECSVKALKPATQATALEIPTKVTIEGDEYYVTEIDSLGFRQATKFTSLVLPDSLKIIRGRAFYNCSGLTGDLVIPNNVTYIGQYAFYGCHNFKGTLTLSDKLVAIGNYAFSRNSTNMGFTGDLVIPNNVKTIGNYAFQYCSNFKSLTLSENLTSIGSYAFYYCSGFTSNLVIPNSVTTIDSYAFYNCSGFKSLTLSESLTSIASNTFYGCTGFSGDLVIPNSVTTIGNYAFYNCRGFNGTLTLSESLTSIGTYAFSSSSSSYPMHFKGDLMIPNSVTSIGSNAFQYCSYFDGSLILSENLTSIATYAFNNCSGFTGSLTIPGKVTSIGNYAFQNCSNFDGNLTLPASLTSIGTSAFASCSKISEMSCLATTPPSASSSSFSGHNIAILYVPEEAIDAYYEVSPWYDFWIMGLVNFIDFEVEVKDDDNNVLYSLIYNTTDDFTGVSVKVGQKPTTNVDLAIPESVWNPSENFTYNVTEISDDAFKDCSNFISIEIPKYIKEIGQNAFSGCNNVNKIISHNNYPPTTGNNCFYGISDETQLLVPITAFNNYNTQPWNRFNITPLMNNYEHIVQNENGITLYSLLFSMNDDYKGLKVKIGTKPTSSYRPALNIPDSLFGFPVTIIEDNAFGNCYYFSSLQLPENLTYIGDYAFAGSSSGSSVSSMGFAGELEIPSSVTYIGDHAFYLCNKFTSLTFEENSKLETIGDYAFAGYKYSNYYGQSYNSMNFAGELEIPSSVTYIGDHAFYLCNKFTSLTFEENSKLETIGDYAFAGGYRIEKRDYDSNYDGVYDANDYDTYDYSMQFAGELSIPNNVVSIGNYAFYTCDDFTSLRFENDSKLDSIGNYAFSGYYDYFYFYDDNDNETKVDVVFPMKFTGDLSIPNSVSFIGEYAFRYCNFTGDIIIGDNSTTSRPLAIERYSFSDCSANGLKIGNNVTSIGDYAFAGSAEEVWDSNDNYYHNYYNVTTKNFTGELVISNSVTSIGKYAFYLCDKFSSIKFEENSKLETIGDYAFAGFVAENYYDDYINDNNDYNNYIPYAMGFVGELVIPNSVTSIGNYAFYLCNNMTSLKFEENSNLETIGNYAFGGYSWNEYVFNTGFEGELVIPNSVVSIGDYAFYLCNNFYKLKFEDGSKLETIGSHAFAGYSWNGAIYMAFTGELIIPNSVTSIGNYAFECCYDFTKLKFEENSKLQTIGSDAFAHCKGFSGELVIPKNVTSIKSYAFYNCEKITSLTFEEGSKLENIESSAFSNNKKLSTVTSPATEAPTLGNNVFSNISDSTRTLYYPEESILSYLEKGWFNYFPMPESMTLSGKCGDNLTWEVNTDDGILKIEGSGNMYDYDNSNNIAPWRNVSNYLKELELGNGITSIGNYAFCYCDSIRGELNIPDGVTYIGDYAFAGNWNRSSNFTGELIIPNSVTYIGNWAFYNCDKFTSLTFEDNSQFETIGNYAFGSCNGFTGELTIPNSVTSIGDWAFSNCNKFTSLTFEDNSQLETIGNYAFSSCNGFTGELTIPNSVTSIGYEAFYNCDKFTSLSFEENSQLETIGNYAFGYCSFTGELVIPGSVTFIGWNAFDGGDFDKITCLATTPADTYGHWYEDTYDENGDYVSIYHEGPTPIFGLETTGMPMIYVPASAVNTYKSSWNSIYESYFYRDGYPTFIKSGGHNVVTNWHILENGQRRYRLPEETEDVIIAAPLTINNGSELKVNSIAIGTNGDLTLKEGGQLRCNNINSDIKVEKSIAAHSTSGNTTWTTISSPFAADINPSNVTNLTSGNYSLYRYDEPSAVWQNYKNSANNGFTTLEAGRGYIYSHSDNTTLTFNGKSKASYVIYELTNESEILSGFHLIGNPYTHNITMDNMVTSTSGAIIKKAIFELKDSYGDGWNGCALEVSNSDGSIDKHYTISSGYTATYELWLTGDVTIKWVKGQFPSECSFVIKTESGETILNMSTGTLNNVANGEILKTFNAGTPKDILADGYYSLSNEGAWGVKYGEETEIKPCQGILVKTTEAGYLNINSTVTATRGAKRNSISDVLAISVANNKYEDIAYISFNEGTGLDKIAHENENIPMVYIPCQDADYAIAIQDKDFEEIPVNFEAGSMGEYTISISQKECGFKQLYLYDKVTDKIIDILRHDYTFFATTTEDPARFVLKPVCDVVLDEFAYINNGSLIIGNIVGNATINIYDVLGRSVLNSTCSDSEYDVSTERLASGVYIIHKSDDNGLKTQKVVIE